VLLQLLCDQRGPVGAAGTPGLRGASSSRSVLLQESWRTSRRARPGAVWRTGASCGSPVRPMPREHSSARCVSGTPDRAALVGGSEADVGPAVVGLEDGIECHGQSGEVAVVDPPVIELLSQLSQRLRPIPAGERQPRRDFHAPLDDLDCRTAGGRSPRLLPGALPARRRAPGGDAPAGFRLDRPAAPPARRGGSAAIGRIRRCGGGLNASGAGARAGCNSALRGRRYPWLLTGLPLSPPLPRHGSQRIHHDGIRSRRCKRCNGLRS
jgi:hypothetical protein